MMRLFHVKVLYFPLISIDSYHYAYPFPDRPSKYNLSEVIFSLEHPGGPTGPAGRPGQEATGRWR